MYTGAPGAAFRESKMAAPAINSRRVSESVFETMRMAEFSSTRSITPGVSIISARPRTVRNSEPGLTSLNRPNFCSSVCPSMETEPSKKLITPECAATMVWAEAAGERQARTERKSEAREVITTPWIKDQPFVNNCQVGRTPWSARVPQDPLSLRNGQADVGVGRGPGGPPHVAFQGGRWFSMEKGGQ